MRETDAGLSVELKNGSRASLEYIACPLCGSSESTLAIEARETRYGTTDHVFQITRCDDCGLYFLNPRPTVDSLGVFYSADYYEPRKQAEAEAVSSMRPTFGARFGSSLAEARKEAAFNERLRIVRNAVTTPGRVLDVGSAAGDFLILMKSHGWDVSGVEMDERMCQYVRETQGLPVMQGVLSEVELPEDSFDLITMWESLEHMPNPVETFRQLRAALRQRGHIILSVPNIRSLAARVAGGNWSHLDAPRHLCHFSKESLYKLCELTDFQPVSWSTSSSICGSGFSPLVARLLVFIKSRPKLLPIRVLWHTSREISQAIGSALGKVAALLGQGDTGILVAKK